MWGAIKKFLGVLTDILTLGRGAGWWSKNPSPTDVPPTNSVNDSLKKK